MSNPERFVTLSRKWSRGAWDELHARTFTWRGRRCEQLPEDLMRIQEVIWQVKPDVVIEIGVQDGGSLLFYSDLVRQYNDNGLVIGVDRSIGPAAALVQVGVSLVQGDSVSDETVERVRQLIYDEDRALVILDSLHTYEHVLTELRLYAPLVAQDSYAIVLDGIMEEWTDDNPARAARDFVAETNGAFDFAQPENTATTFIRDGWLKRVR